MKYKILYHLKKTAIEAVGGSGDCDACLTVEQREKKREEDKVKESQKMTEERKAREAAAKKQYGDNTIKMLQADLEKKIKELNDCSYSLSLLNNELQSLLKKPDSAERKQRIKEIRPEKQRLDTLNSTLRSEVESIRHELELKGVKTGGGGEDIEEEKMSDEAEIIEALQAALAGKIEELIDCSDRLSRVNNELRSLTKKPEEVSPDQWEAGKVQRVQRIKELKPEKQRLDTLNSILRSRVESIRHELELKGVQKKVNDVKQEGTS
jgi:hypothetical protein